MSDEPKDYEVTLEVKVMMTYYVDAYTADQAEELAEAEMTKQLPADWQVQDVEVVEAYSDADVEDESYKDDQPTLFAL